MYKNELRMRRSVCWLHADRSSGDDTKLRSTKENATLILACVGSMGLIGYLSRDGSQEKSGFFVDIVQNLCHFE